MRAVVKAVVAMETLVTDAESSTIAYRVRPARVADVGAIRAVASITWEVTYRDSIAPANRQRIVYNSYNPATLSQAIARVHSPGLPTAWFFVAETVEPQPEIVGFAEATLQPGGDSIELTRIYVLPHHQGGGVGTLLLDALLDSLRVALARGELALTAPRLTLVVEAHNARAKAFYQRRGFRQIRAYTHALYGQIVALEVYGREIAPRAYAHSAASQRAAEGRREEK